MDRNRKVLVTGASRGIGKAICARLRDDGYQVVGLARTPPAGLDGVAFHAVDLSDRAAAEAALGALAADGAFYGLVNNVGAVPLAALGEIEEADLMQAVTMNLATAIHCAQALLPGMRAAGIGRIVNIASRAALGKAGRSVYSATKAGLIGMTRTWALETAAQGITVNAVAPGPIDTEFFREANPPGAESTRRLEASIPVGRLGRPDEVAHATAYLLDARAGFVTGQTHYVCGGMTIGAA
ncbi:SDR family oxidoreductase [Verticiella sediminum]|uniref:SDR family oxidoreductase n=1 Tax=Verticiella sediminum TaxID=1247510 RepID=A0A556AIV8_9BURK|nr:SDR family oxidoreductase [Verticiella sediminum]TSH92817.1 SDR family oxidoreductase [Verticiella sediminum]